MGKPHKHAAIITAWAAGAEIQFKHKSSPIWKDLTDPFPEWLFWLEYRIKPQPIKIKYRVALLSGDGYNTVMTATTKEESQVANRCDFVRWLTDWIAVEV